MRDAVRQRHFVHLLVASLEIVEVICLELTVTKLESGPEHQIRRLRLSTTSQFYTHYDLLISK